VEPNAEHQRTLTRILRLHAEVVVCSEFHVARQQIREATPRLLIANLRLRAYNGLHLVALAGPAVRAVVYMDPQDVGLLRIAQDSGAFVERPERLIAAAPSYLNTDLPPQDRRAVERYDRRYNLRGGRRAADHPTGAFAGAGWSRSDGA
jgi:hypothetical protein